MAIIRTIIAAVAIVTLAGCSSRRDDSGSGETTESTENIQLDTAGLQGDWSLASYRIDCESTCFEGRSRFILSFNEPDNTFGLSTDCNRIGGKFDITNDTIRFKDMMATEMACDEMAVEESMLRLLNDSTAFAICTGDTILFTAPYIGNATFVKVDTESGQ